MEHGREHLDAGDEAWPRPREIATARRDIHHGIAHSLLPWRIHCYPFDVRDRLLEIIATGHRNHEAWPSLFDVHPRNRDGRNAGASEEIAPAGALDHLGDPVAAGVRRVEPFETDHRDR